MNEKCAKHKKSPSISKLALVNGTHTASGPTPAVPSHHPTLPSSSRSIITRVEETCVSSEGTGPFKSYSDVIPCPSTLVLFSHNQNSVTYVEPSYSLVITTGKQAKRAMHKVLFGSVVSLRIEPSFNLLIIELFIYL